METAIQTKLFEDFVSAYVEHPGDYTWKEALEIANERDEAANELFLTDVDSETMAPRGWPRWFLFSFFTPAGFDSQARIY